MPGQRNSKRIDKLQEVSKKYCIESTLQYNADLSNFTDDRKESERKEEPFLFHVVRKGLDSAVEMFLQRQLDVNQRGKNGLTAAMIAAEIGSAEKMQMLLDNGADIANLVDDEGETVLHKSSHWSKGNVVLLKFLISEGAQVNVLDNLGRSPLHWAVIQGHTSTAETLLCYNVDEVIDLDDRFQHRPIHYAIRTCRSDVAQLLVNNNCKLDDEEAMGDSMLIYAVKNGDRPMCELMLRHCKNANDVDLQGWTALHHAVQRGDPGICQLLLTKSSTKNMPDHEHRQTPIYVAVSLCQIEIVTLLLEHGVKLFCFDDKKR
ncbi:putative ankyrin-3 [Apostichopus japonicus]|uniref:Putative ankyrin-3 n=1 Tax=Stichopus japonicus TaxID=307972 RepID=A0A2G8JVE2_STIJA|nr:putative ankyrin-3 [Apostichopus japonicus]